MTLVLTDESSEDCGDMPDFSNERGEDHSISEQLMKIEKSGEYCSKTCPIVSLRLQHFPTVQCL